MQKHKPLSIKTLGSLPASLSNLILLNIGYCVFMPSSIFNFAGKRNNINDKIFS